MFGIRASGDDSLGAAGKEALAAQSGPSSPAALARAGTMVVLADVRGYGKLFSAS